jgi:glycosyltransferase involved in cell wall biosynthesis
MKVSVITSCFNSASTIRTTLESVRVQSYDDLEYIIIDGGSTDQTLELVADFDDCVSILQSEPDQGIYDALNKGIALATGEVVGFLHSDDFFSSPDSVARIVEAFQSSGADAVYANLDYVAREQPDRIVRKWRSQSFEPELFYRGWMPAHPTFYLKRKYYEEFGSYDLDFRQSADYELMLRMLLKHGCSAHFLNEVIIKMRTGGASNVSLRNRWRANQEDARAWKKNGLKANTFTRFLKPLSKLGQFLSQ